MKILALDIETAPNTVHVWGLWKQNVAINQILETGRVMCFAARWLGAKKNAITFLSEYETDRPDMLLAARDLLTEADAVLTFNGESFDLPTLNKEFLEYNLAPPAPYASIDLLRVAKRRFRFVSNKMDHLAGELDITRKLSHSGHKLWIDCMNGDERAWRTMKQYNIQDVRVLEELYHKMLPWIDTHPNRGLHREGARCPNCGSTRVHSRGVQRNKTLAYQRYQCQDCGAWMRSARFDRDLPRAALVPIGGR